MPEAVERLHRAVSERAPILLYGDYDVDGTSSVVILKKAIELAGGTAEFHIPHRLLEGYGMRSEVVDEAAARGIRLIISVDTGIRAGEVVRHANALGIDVIVTDHHLPEAEIPPAAAVLNPVGLDDVLERPVRVEGRLDELAEVAPRGIQGELHCRFVGENTAECSQPRFDAQGTFVPAPRLGQVAEQGEVAFLQGFRATLDRRARAVLVALLDGGLGQDQELAELLD